MKRVYERRMFSGIYIENPKTHTDKIIAEMYRKSKKEL